MSRSQKSTREISSLIFIIGEFYYFIPTYYYNNMLRVRNQRASKAISLYAAVSNGANTVTSNNVLPRGPRGNRRGSQVRPSVADSSNINPPPTQAAPPTPAAQASTEAGQGMSRSGIIGMSSHNMPPIYS